MKTNVMGISSMSDNVMGISSMSDNVMGISNISVVVQMEWNDLFFRDCFDNTGTIFRC